METDANECPSKYSIGEKVLCYHGILIYEAKCLMVKHVKETNSHEYRVHYQGWSKKWDDWVPEGRLLKYNDANLAKQKELIESQNAKKTKRKSGCSKSVKSEPAGLSEPKSADVKLEEPAVDSDSRSSTPMSVDGKKQLRAKKPRRSSVAQSSRASTPPPPSPTQPKPPVSTPMQVVTVNIERCPVDRVVEKTDEPDTDPPIDADAASEEQQVKVEPGILHLIKHEMEEAEQLPSPPPPPPPPKPVKPRIVKLSEIQFNMPAAISQSGGCRLKIPAALENWIIEDWYQLTQSHPRWVTLPAELTVADIMARYLAFKMKYTPLALQQEIQDGGKRLERLFNVCLGRFLLHKWERLQYADLLEQHPNTPASQLYGAHHFLRMFAMLAESLAKFSEPTNLDPVQSILGDVMDFLVYQEKSFFKIANYSPPPPEYHRRTL